MIALLAALAGAPACAADVVIQSHRGAGALAPENTIAAFELGWTLGTIPEADLRTTRDGVIVAFHDGHFGRVAKNAGPELRGKGIEDLTLGELAAIDVGGPIPTMREVFAAMKRHVERRLYLDIKEVELPRLARLVRDEGVARRVILASTRYELVKQWRALVPESGTLLWMGGTEAELEGRLAELREARFAAITQLQIHVHPPGHARALSETFVRALGAELRARGILYQALPWGAREPAGYTRLLELGVVSLATDYPDVAREAVRAFCSARPGRRR